MDYRNELNESQFEAVSSEFQHNRIIAGAGSGKTRVLTYRISYLIDVFKVRPWNILAITFTNKVAKEMKERVVKLVPYAEKDLMIKTFHSFAAYFLRIECSVLNFPSSFTIFDEDDQKQLIKDIAANMGYKKSDPIIKRAISYISSHKLKNRYPADINIKFETFEGERDCLEIYSIYEEEKDKMFAFDFDDLLLKTNYILTEFPDIRIKWQRKIQHILIDEFQDTNDVEYRLVRLLSSSDTSLYVVGDPDQTIYTWRGANQDIILNIEKDYRGINTIVLERNYRSTQTILNSANKLISCNKMRVPKNLYTENKGGSPIITKVSSSINTEAEYVAKEVLRLHQNEKIPYKDIALLYRSNYITLEFESAFTNRQIPYRIYGGQKFYQRKEIKDVLAYFRLIVNPNDDVSFKRIYNTPRRGVGEPAFNVLTFEAEKKNLSLYNYILTINDDETSLPSRALGSLKRLVITLEKAKDDISKDEEVFSKILEDMLASLGYYEYLMKEEDGDDRVDNVKALFAMLRSYLKNNPEATFDEYLQNISLVSSQDEIENGDFVQLMTVHTAKGLEFPIVFVVRFNDGVFPSSRALLEGGFKSLEEERRLAYVAMTRAKNKLYLSCASGFNYVVGGSLNPSQFYKESGNVLDIDRYSPSSYGDNYSRSNGYHSSSFFDDGDHISAFEEKPKKGTIIDDIQDNGITDWQIGDKVEHRKLGKGVVVGVSGDGIIDVEFEEHGLKKVLGNHPALKRG